jgi:putative addiction module CopG family antidote
MGIMNIALTKHFEEMIAGLVASGRYINSSEVVRAGLRILDAKFALQARFTLISWPASELRPLMAW